VGRTAHQPLDQHFVAVPQVSVSIDMESVLVKVSGSVSECTWTV
jgi:hypothetical protein